MKQIALKLPLHLDNEAVKQLEKVKKITNEPTATKAITKALFDYTYYKDNYEKAVETISNLNLQLTLNKSAISVYLLALEELKEINNSKQNTANANAKGKKNLQLRID